MTQSVGAIRADAWGRGVFGALRSLMHLIAASQFWYACYYDWHFVHVPQNVHRMGNPFGGKFKYLTFLDAILQALYFTICVLNDLVGTNEISPKRIPLIRKLKDYIMAAFAFPVAMNVGVTFWSLMAIDRELVFPKSFDAFFPNWLNHVMHTNIMIFILMDMFITFRQYPTRKSGLTGSLIFMLSYLVWLHVIKHYSGIWVYPVLEVFNLPQRIAFFAVSFVFSVALYILGEKINNSIWRKELKSVKSPRNLKSK